MDRQNPNPDAPKHVPTEAEIARLEAEAVAALQRGEPIARPDGPAGDPAPAIEPEPRRPDFVPYVDDVPEPQPQPAAADAPPDAVGDDADDDDEDYIPSPWEKRIDALSAEQWRRWQILGGGAVGLLAIASLFVFGQELSTYGLVLAVLLAILLPRYLERAWRRKLSVARRAMVVAMIIGLVAFMLIIGIRTGFRFTSPE